MLCCAVTPQQEWRIAEAELEPVISREKETYSRYADLAFQVESENAQSELRKSQQNRQSQAALAKTMVRHAHPL